MMGIAEVDKMWRWVGSLRSGKVFAVCDDFDDAQEYSRRRKR